MGDTYSDLLNDPWISVTGGSGHREQHNLAEVLARLSRSEITEFPALQSQQQQAWHAFLVQLAALALHRGGEQVLPEDSGTWKSWLARLTDDPLAWHLVGTDLSRPAFFQPPLPEGHLKGFKRSSSSPEILDVLITAKNHDVKADRYSRPATVEQWAFALITLQTFQGFLGRGNYGIARMNGGFASRPEVALVPGLAEADRFHREVRLLLEQRQSMIDDHGFAPSGHALLWRLPWEGKAHEVLALDQLDPFFLEVCRRVRLVGHDDSIQAVLAPTQAPRVDSKAQQGDLGDVWTPVRLKDGAALTVSEAGFHYRLVQGLLFGQGYRLPPALEVQQGDTGEVLALFRVLARGQGKTGGWHERYLPIPSRVLDRFSRSEDRESMGLESKDRVEKAGDVQRKLLKPALLALSQERVDAAPDQRLDFQDRRPDPWLRRFDEEVDRVFFERLFGDLEDDVSGEERQRRWQACLSEIAERIFREAQQVLAPGGVHRYRALARAESLFYRLRRKASPALATGEAPSLKRSENPGNTNMEATIQ